MEREQGKGQGNGKKGLYQGMMSIEIGAIEGEEQTLLWVPDQEDFHGNNEWWSEEDYSVDGEWPDDYEDNYIEDNYEDNNNGFIFIICIYYFFIIIFIIFF
jgi:hypothetical protein